RHLKALEIRGEIEPIGTEEGVIFKRQRAEERLETLPTSSRIENGRIRRLGDCRVREADLDHDQERKKEEGDEPEVRNEHDQPCPPRPVVLPTPVHRSVRHVALAYRVSTMAASGAQVSHTRSSQPIGRSTSRVTLATAAFMTIPLSSRTL